MRPRSSAAVLFLLISQALSPALAAQLESFSPRGLVKAPRQVAARFSAPMVAFGDLRRPAPFEIDCPAAGEGRWLDSRNWVLDFTDAVPPGVRCRFRVRDGLVDLAGEPVAAEEIEIHTGGPQVDRTQPFAGDQSIAEEQAFVLLLDSEVDPASVEANVWFNVSGINERIEARLLDDPRRAAVARILSPDWREQPFVVVQARQRFPSAAVVTLVWGQGVLTPSGVPSETEQKLEFRVRPPFRAEVRCRRNQPKAGCIPLLPIALDFSAPVPWAKAREIRLRASDGRSWPPVKPQEDETSITTVEFAPPFPEASRLNIEIPEDLADDSGRLLPSVGEPPLAVRTDTYPPLAKFSGRFGILEANAEPALPVTVRNVEAELQLAEQQITEPRDRSLRARLSRFAGRLTGNVRRLPADRLDLIQPWLRKLGSASHERSIFADDEDFPNAEPRRITLPKPHDAQVFEVIGIPLGEPGLYLVEIESPRLGATLLGENKTFYVPTAALVTNLAVHFKWGEQGSLVWVSTLDEAQPVAGAEIAILDCAGNAVWNGSSDAAGIARVGALPARKDLPGCDVEDRPSWGWSPDSRALDDLTGGLLVVARNHEDVSFVHSGWNDGIDPWRFGFPTGGWRADDLTAHTILDRPLYRAGETVHMKHLLRRQSLDGFEAPSDGDRPTTVAIVHEGSDQRFELPLELDAGGTGTGTWEIPRDAKLGRYRVDLQGSGSRNWTSASFRVSEFRLPLMKATVGLPAEVEVGSSSIPVDLSAQYLSGGVAAGLPVTFRTQVRPRPFSPSPPFDRFVFGQGPLDVGIRRRGFYEDEAAAEAPPPVLQRTSTSLDAGGTARVVATDVPDVSVPSELLAEMELRDPNGEIQTIASTLPLWPARWIAGLRSDDWLTKEDRLSPQVAVLDRGGDPVADAPVRIEVFQRKTFSNRKRIVGGFYAYEHVTEISGPLTTLCEGRTAANGIFVCDAEAPATGELLLQATATDPDGHATVTHTSVWIGGEDDWWFDIAAHDRMDVLPERVRYQPGETARLQVRMPFRSATALVTVEREGILDAQVVTLSGSEPVVEVPIAGHYAPNAYVSVLAVRGRVGDVQPTARLDLGKPAFRLGVAELQVDWSAHQLDVQVRPEREVYRVRERAAVEIEVRGADGRALPQGSEVAVAAIDAGLLELAANDSWDLLDAMMGRRDYGVNTATAQLQVVGKRHFGRKALPAGGGGGRQSTRELFDTLLLWVPRLPLDADGRTRVEVPLNDSLTSFRIAAIATAGADRFGTGTATIRSTQDLMILAGLPPVVRDGDRFRAELTLRNTTDRDLDVVLDAEVEGLSAGLPQQSFALTAGEARVVGWPIVVPAGIEALQWSWTARAGGATDGVRAQQRVLPAVPTRPVQATLHQVRAEIAETIERPADALADRGGIEVALSPSLTVSLDGVRSWLHEYPYTCLEQRVSVVVGTGDADAWRALAGELPAYADDDGLLKYFRDMERGSDVLTAYVVSISQAAGLELPEASRNQAVEALKRFVRGEITPPRPFVAVDLAVRKLGAIEALSRLGAAEPELLQSITVEPQLWPNVTLVDWLAILERLPDLPEREQRLAEVENVLRSRLSAQGTTLGFAASDADRLWWLMVTPDVPQARLLLEVLARRESWEAELPRLARGTLARMRRGHWDSTVANAWGAVALTRFAQAFESETIAGTTDVHLVGRPQRIRWSSPRAGRTATFSWPGEATELRLMHRGSGAPWAMVQARAAIPLQAPIQAGYVVRKTITPVEQRQQGSFSAGDILRVRLEVDASSDMTWVVIDDPLPAAASHLGTGLARDSAIATAGEQQGEWWERPTYTERRFDALRAYYEYVPQGTFVLEYTMRLNQSGTFQLPPTRVEALYAPEMFAELPNQAMEIQP